MPSIVTDQEIQREIDTLRSLRRRSGSGGPGSLLVDPDLPPPTSSALNGGPTSPGVSSPSRRPRGLSNPRSPHSPNGYDAQRSPTSPTGGGSLSLSRSFSREGDGPVAVVGMAHAGHDGGDADGGASLHVTGGAIAPSPQDDPTHLFWVPAHLHPELAPGEFRAFLKSHTQPEGGDGDAAPGEGAGEASLAFGGGAGLERRLSALSRRSSLGMGGGGGGSAHAMPASGGGGGGLGRKRSMLSRQYHPRANDHVEDEPPLPPGALARADSRRSSIYGGRTGEQDLTLVDLQRLEELADEAASSGDGDLGKMRNLLRRSLSISATGLPGDEDGLASVDENDAPIIIPPRGQILRRTARTKIRKAHLPGDGGGHRFGPRKVRSGLGSPDLGEDDDARDDGRLSPYGGVEGERRRVSDRSEDGSDEMHSAESGYVPGERVGLRDERYDTPEAHRKLSTDSTEESAVYDSYGDTSVESSVESSKQDMEDLSHDGHEEIWDEHQQRTPTGQSYEDETRRRVVGDRAKSPEQVFTTPPSSPDTIRREPVAPPSDYRSQPNPYEQLQAQQPLRSPPGAVPPPSPYQQDDHHREAVKVDIVPPPRSVSPAPSTDSKRDKEKKSGFFSKKDKESKTKKGDKEKKDKEKDGFLGSLFGSKKKHEEPPAKFSSSAGSAAAAALLGSSKSAKSVGLGAPSPTSPAASAINNYARYPIHVERAVYRLSHIKLANPRRPLYEQVLISNLMFWYLSIINRTHNTPTTPTTAAAGEKEKSPTSSSDNKPAISAASEAKPRSSPTPAVPKPQPPSAALQSSMQNAVEQSKRGSLSKVQTGPPSRARQAEMPVRQPQYGMQLQLEKEYQRQGPHANGPPHSQQARTPPSTGPVSLGPQSQPPSQQSHQRAQSQPPQPQIMPQQGPREKPRSASSSITSRDVPPPLIIPAQHDPRRPQSPHDQYPPVSEIRRSSGERMNLSGGLEPPRPARQGPSPPPADRRDVRPGPPRQPQPPQHSGVKPGQVFQYPSGMMNVQPGQVFPPQVGQVFHHPQYTPPNPAAYNPGPAGHSGQNRPGPSPQQSQRNLPWAEGGPAQLPPGAMPPRSMSVPQDQRQWAHPPPPGPQRQYDLAPNGYSAPPTGDPRQRQPMQAQPQQPQRPGGPPQRSQQYPQQHPHPGPSQNYAPYGRQPELSQGQRPPPGHQQVAPGMLYDGVRR